MSKLYVGVDIGGTSIVAARFSESELLERAEVPTGAERPAEEIMNSLFEAIDEVLTNEVVGIGIGMPGFMNVESGEILQINNIPSFNGFSVKQAVVKKFNLPTFQNNDANCFALGETYYGAGKKYKNLVGVTLGTGLGGGIILDRKIHTGLMGGAGELGCVPFHGGISEDICSAALFKNKYKTTGTELYKKAKAGDQEALAVFDELARNIGELLRIVMYVLAPEAFVIGGSVANSWDLLEKPLREEVNKFLVPMISNKVELVRAELDNAGLYGAAALCISQMD
ncbi:MAG: ROK family protein [Bacteroidia bacterium]|nr:MAG: ROK family protein [Bacteroidia bacterium]